MGKDREARSRLETEDIMNRRSFFASIFGAAGCLAVNPFKFLGGLTKAKPMVNAFAEPIVEPIAGTVRYDVTIGKVEIFNGEAWSCVETQ